MPVIIEFSRCIDTYSSAKFELLNSNVAYEILKMLSPTINVEAGDVKNMPVIIEHKNEVEEIVSDCIKEEEAEWDSFEQSWNFCKHPLI